MNIFPCRANSVDAVLSKFHSQRLVVQNTHMLRFTLAIQ